MSRPAHPRPSGILLTAVAALLVLVIGACSALDQAKDNAITEAAIGTWHCTEDYDDGSVETKTITVGDGTFRLDDDDTNGLEGTWEITDGQLHITHEEGGSGFSYLVHDADQLSEQTSQVDADFEKHQGEPDADIPNTVEFSLRAAVDVISRTEVRFYDTEYRDSDTPSGEWEREDQVNAWVCTKSG